MTDFEKLLTEMSPEEREAALATAQAFVRKQKRERAKAVYTENIRKGREKAQALGILGGVRKRFSETTCNCGAGNSLKHERLCPRYRFVYRRIAEVREKLGVKIDIENDSLSYAESLWDQISPQRLKPKN